MKKLSLIILAFLLLITFSACSFSIDPTDIMHPPKSTGVEAKIDELIRQYANKNFSMIYPKSGSNKSSVIFCDINGEHDKAIACFKTLDDSKNHLLFINISGDDYTAIDCQEFKGTDIDRIEFADLDGDTKNEVIISGREGTSIKNQLFIYKLTDEYVVTYETPCICSSYVTGDFTNDNKTDLLLLSVRTDDIEAQAKLITFSDNVLTELSSCDLDVDIVKYLNLSFGKVNDNSFGAICDGINSKGEISSQLIYLNPHSKELENPLMIYSGYSSTKRTVEILSRDIDDDEITEIPVFSTTYILQDNSEDKGEVKEILWSDYDFDNMSLHTKAVAFCCFNDEYMFILPDSFVDATVAKYDKENNEMTVYAINYSGNDATVSDRLFSIKAFPKSEFTKNETEYSEKGYAEILRSGANVFAAKIYDSDNYLSISGEEIANHFSPVAK